MSVLTPAELHSLTRMERLAHDVIRQCEHLRRNMEDHDTHDRIRFCLIETVAARLYWAAGVAERRYLAQYRQRQFHEAWPERDEAYIRERRLVDTVRRFLASQRDPGSRENLTSFLALQDLLAEGGHES